MRHFIVPMSVNDVKCVPQSIFGRESDFYILFESFRGQDSQVKLYSGSRSACININSVPSDPALLIPKIR